MELAVRWERQAKQLGPIVHLKNRYAILDALAAASQKVSTGDFDEGAAREALNTILGAIGENEMRQESVREFAERWLAAREHEWAATTLTAYKAAIRMFLKHLGAVGEKPLGSVQTKHIEAFKASRISTGASAKTIDRDLKVVRAIFNAAIKQGQLSFDPSQAVSLTARKSKSHEQQVTREIFDDAELDTILATVTGDWLTATLIGRYTGARIGDCVRMRWSNVDLETSVIRYIDGKTGKRYAIPMHPRLKQHLLKTNGTKEATIYLSPYLAQRSTGGDSGLSTEFISFMREAGVDPMVVPSKSLRQVEGKKPRMVATRSFHSLRHTYNTQLAMADVPQEIRRKLIGHTSDTVNDIYTHTDVELFRGAIYKLK